MVKQFRKKPVVIEAVRWDGNNVEEILEFIYGENPKDKMDESFKEFETLRKNIIENGLKIDTLEGIMTASIGDYIIKGVNGEFYPCKADIFEKTYEVVSDNDRPITIEVVKGVAGDSLYINNIRVSGNKPWGGGRVLHEFKTTEKEIDKAINFLK